MMKKSTIYVSALVLIISIISQAQTVIIDRPVNEDIYVLSTKRTDGTLFIAADSFELTEETAIGEIDVPGALMTNIGYLGTMEKGFNVYIYEDDNGLPSGDPTQPGSGIVELSDIPPVYYSKYENGLPFYNRTDFNRIQITAANGGNQVILQPGTYWISFFVTVEGEGAGPAPNDVGKWAWLGSSTAYPAPPIEPAFIDPFDIYGGLTNWTIISSVNGGYYPSCGWTMRNEEIVLGTEENELSKVEVYPNPSPGIVNVSIPDNVKVLKSALFDMSGKKMDNVELKNNSLDISLLPKGVYLLKIETSKGILTKKIIRK